LFQNITKMQRSKKKAGRPQDPHPTAPMPKQLSARRSEQRSFPGSKLVRREFTYGLLSREESTIGGMSQA